MQYQQEIWDASEEYLECVSCKGQRKEFHTTDITVAFTDGAEWMFRNLWISLDQDLPGLCEPVVVRTKNGALIATARTGSESWAGMSPRVYDCITHWMYIPRPPKDAHLFGISE